MIDLTFGVWEKEKVTDKGILWHCSICGKGQHLYDKNHTEHKEKCPDCDSEMLGYNGDEL